MRSEIKIDCLDSEVIDALKHQGVVVLRTDTIYGIVACADDERAVEWVYELKGRDDNKSPIVLVSSVDQLYDDPKTHEAQFLSTVWPGKISVILPSKKAPNWLRRGNESVAYRLPADAKLRTLIDTVGPLIAPSANPQGEAPAMTIQQAIEFFGDKVDYYIDGGEVFDSTPSQLVRVDENGVVERLR